MALIIIEHKGPSTKSKLAQRAGSPSRTKKPGPGSNRPKGEVGQQGSVLGRDQPEGPEVQVGEKSLGLGQSRPTRSKGQVEPKGSDLCQNCPKGRKAKSDKRAGHRPNRFTGPGPQKALLSPSLRWKKWRLQKKKFLKLLRSKRFEKPADYARKSARR